MKDTIIREALERLQTEIDPVTRIRLSPDQAALAEALTVFERCGVERQRLPGLLTVYILLSSALDRHAEPMELEDAELTRRILDGDYLYSLYIQYALKCREGSLMRGLSPFVKKIQIARALGRNGEVPLLSAFEQVLMSRKETR
ncbi:hypothetical protein [Saccharibacillus kuerlensis]|uniref:Uncharacterized protein n=1 Tax=Saccharibacillus kuerlensis TaxID=459527 RepID=A0ABQ2L1R2_9BACL|nr:hypothetical protein [Saccharibacillus kuerlensis]GGN99744.1 hypothetical protein GCM10010969_20140 [Saccharibacillus kuerlensis]